MHKPISIKNVHQLIHILTLNVEKLVVAPEDISDSRVSSSFSKSKTIGKIFFQFWKLLITVKPSELAQLSPFQTSLSSKSNNVVDCQNSP